MATLEEEFLESLLKNSGCGGGIDDISRIWHHGENERKRFIDKPNEFPPIIKLTCDYSQERVHILDVQAILEDNDISSSLCVKETDSHQCLHPSSYHSHHCVKSIASSQTLRIN